MKYLVPIFSLLLAACGGDTLTSADFTSYVAPHIGSGGHGHVFVGANVPFGMVQVGPTSIPQSWDWCSGYHQSDSTVIGFSHTHLSGTGIGDLFDVTVMPVTGEVAFARGTEDDPQSGMWSYADRRRECAEAGYYSVPLVRYGIKAEMTATERVGFHRYTFPQSDDAAIVIDLENGGCWDKTVDAGFTLSADSTCIEGWRRSSGWAADQQVFFSIRLSKPFRNIRYEQPSTPSPAEASGSVGARYARAEFGTAEGEIVMMKVALSPVSIEGARANMEAELPHWNFDAARRDADAAWERELGKVRIETADETARTIFYTALYHTMAAPALFCDTDGRYRGADGQIRTAGHKTYTIFSLWDTYRAAMPLMTILHPEKMPDIINTMLDICDAQGRLPVWHLWGNETDCMVGNPAIPAVADAIVKGIGGFDPQRAFRAIKATAMNGGRGGELRSRYGYIPCEMMNESAAYELEYALADGAAAAAARKLGLDEDARFFGERSRSYRRLFDPSTRFIRGRDSRGEWRMPFSPFASNHRADDYCEGNAWQYTWLVPHDVDGLAACFGGRGPMIEKLDSLFTVDSALTGDDISPDISGMIGQYAHGNEPSHHILYLYTMLGQPWKTADLVREVLTTLYHADADGLSGNEDAGQMSAWYVMSALGFYEVEPAGGRYWFGAPLFDRATIALPDGGRFTVTAEGLSSENRYVQSITLNGKPHRQPFITHDEIMSGGELRFAMGAEPTRWYNIEE